MSHGGHHGHGGHGGHSSHATHHNHSHAAGGHPDRAAIWNSAMQFGEEPRKKKFLKVLPDPSMVPIFIALIVFILMLLPFVIDISQSVR